jgi:hypothetical protein
MQFTPQQIELLKEEAKILIDDGSNIEYTRGICELLAYVDCREDEIAEIRSEQIRDELLGLDYKE